MSATQRFRENDYIDLYDFVMLCKNNIKIDAVHDTASKLLQSLNEIIVANRTHGDSVKNAHGISIYFPLKRPDSEMLNIYNKLDFNIKYKNWLKLVELFHKPKVLKRD